jgi:hypothetical protein
MGRGMASLGSSQVADRHGFFTPRLGNRIRDGFSVSVEGTDAVARP